VITLTPTGNYDLILNGQFVSTLQLSRFKQQAYLNILKKYTVDFNKISMKVPFEYADAFFPAIEDNVIQVNKSGIPIFKGYETECVNNEQTRFFEIESIPFLNFFAKNQTTYNDTTYTNAFIRLIQVLQNMLAKIPNYYTINPIAVGLADNFAGIDIMINSNGQDVNDMDLLTKLLEYLQVGIYFNGLEINFFVIPTYWPTYAVDITETQKPCPITNRPKPACMTEIYCNQTKLTATTAPNGTENTALSLLTSNPVNILTNEVIGSTSSLIFTDSLSNIFMSLDSLQILADRRNQIYSREYKEIRNLEITNLYNEIGLSTFFKYDNYIYVCTGFENRLSSYIIDGIGLQAE
jgi:hypothetical protein